jgi:putative acyl-CoA dehydrogenase
MAASETGTWNQSPPLEGYNLFTTNRPLVDAVRREGGGWAEERLSALGGELGGEPLRWGELANRHVPELRGDEVEFHPAWHSLLALALRHGVHALPWREPIPGAQVARAAAMITLSQAEAGVGCPVSMTYAAVPALRRSAPDLAAEWEPFLTSSEYDFRLRPLVEKRGALCGMAMTERQGGSDVRANLTQAEPLGDAEAVLTGHKWFCSAPMSDAFLVLGQAPPGPTCYLLPRVLPDGTRNGIRLIGLKDKLGNRSNASAEIELDDAWAQRVGEEGDGIRTILEMVVHTRLDCVLGSTALMRRAVSEATHHAAHRSAFGKLLVDQPLMQNVLADLCLESEAATLTALRLARAYDENDMPFRRLATAAAKYWVCKITPTHVAEALECIGGNGYVEESALPRLYRESPLNSIWEGPGNVNALETVRAIRRQPDGLDAFMAELEPSVVPYVTPVLVDQNEGQARRIVERLALALQASLMLRHAGADTAEAFVASRLGGEGGRTYGTLPRGLDFAAIIERHRPHP